MNALVHTGAVLGMRAYPVAVEVEMKSRASSPQSFDFTGIPDEQQRESRVRVRSALKNSGFPWNGKHSAFIRLSPTDIHKEGTSLDLPVALSILCAEGTIPQTWLHDTVFIGELALSGEVRTVRGILPLVEMAKKENKTRIVVPLGNAPEAASLLGIDVFGVTTLREVVGLCQGVFKDRSPFPHNPWYPDTSSTQDVCAIKGHEHAKRALEVSAAGQHNLLIVGPVDSGKTTLARTLPGLLPLLTFEESIEASTVHSVSGLLRDGSLLRSRPFRTPHHTISDAGLTGGGLIPRPGEVSLAHNGVLFLDELPEFRRHVLEMLCQPLRERVVTIARSAATLQYPANFLLVAAMSRCPCGYSVKECTCTSQQIQQYRSRIAPVFDSFDMHIKVKGYAPTRVTARHENPPETQRETTQQIRKRVTSAREIQKERYQGTGFDTNGSVSDEILQELCPLSPGCQRMLTKAAPRFRITLRDEKKIHRVARTIADLSGSQHISPDHLEEAIQYRNLMNRLSR